MRLGVSSEHAVVFHCNLGEKVVVGGIEVADVHTPVPEELVALFRRSDDLTCKDRHPCEHVVAAAGPELFEHCRSPGLVLGLVAVCEDILETLRSHQTVGCVLVHVEICVEEFCPCDRVELVNLKSGSFCRCRVVLLSCE